MQAIVQAAHDRAALRRGVRLPCQVVDEDEFTLLGDLCLDLSLTGMAVRTRRLVALGTPLLVSFRIPGSAFVCDVEAHVARIVWGRRRCDRSLALGLTFDTLDPVSRAVLGTRLRGMPPPTPQRRLRMDYAASVRAIARSGGVRVGKAGRGVTVH